MMASRIATRCRPCTRNAISSLSFRIAGPCISTLNTPAQTSISSGQHRNASTTSTPKTLPLDAFHRAHGAKMVEFAGHSMPLVYSDQTHLDSHHWTRTKASLFDVGHMLQHTISGAGATELLHKLTPSHLPSLLPYQSTLSVLLTQTGGIVDDTIITRLPGQSVFRLVTNGATASKVISYLSSFLSPLHNKSVRWTTTHSHNSGLLALQGPLSAQILGSLTSPLDAQRLKSLYFGQSTSLSLSGISGGPILVSRGGYTGEDGFELATSSPAQTVALAEILLSANTAAEQVKLAGLAARDSLRLEAGMCLYGHDLNEDITPVEAGLGWVIHPLRRSEGGFLGADIILAQLRKKSDRGTGVGRKRVGLIVDGVPAREGAKVYSNSATVAEEGSEIGTLTSGGPSPTLGRNVAMGYLKTGSAKVGTQVKVGVRGKLRQATVTKMPFVEAKYYREVKGEVKVEVEEKTGAAPV